MRNLKSFLNERRDIAPAQEVMKYIQKNSKNDKQFVQLARTLFSYLLQETGDYDASDELEKVWKEKDANTPDDISDFVNWIVSDVNFDPDEVKDIINKVMLADGDGKQLISDEAKVYKAIDRPLPDFLKGESGYWRNFAKKDKHQRGVGAQV